MNTVAPGTKDNPLMQSNALPEVHQLRILATTDLHMHLTAHNFVTDQTTQNPGFSGVATLIKEARAEAEHLHAGCVLFDNGDLLQGTAMGDWLARHPVTKDHPAVACLHALEYDAIGVGNHDLDYGLPYLREVATRLSPPVIASNLSAPDLSPLTPAALIPCTLPASGKHKPQTLQIGVLSVLPQQTALWNQHLLEGVAVVEGAVESLRRAVPALRAQGADLVVLLAHMGLDKDTDGADTTLPLALVPGIDVIVTGHTHRRFPGQDHAQAEGVNIKDSTIAQVPAVMPGHAGSDLAVVDLAMMQDRAGGWRVAHHKSELRRNTPTTHPARCVLDATARVAHRLRTHLSEVAGESAHDLQNYFALVQPTPICALTAQAKARIARIGLKGMAEAALPLIIATSAHTAGGRDGPHNFLHIPKGPVLRRHLTGLNPFGNQVWALRITGAEVRGRLEHAARVFCQLRLDAPAQNLHNPQVPMFNYDTYFGLRYEIDPLKPVGQRISGLRHGKTPVTPEQQFVLITNQFRAAGGGGYPQMPSDRVILRSTERLEDGLREVFAAPEPAPWEVSPWRIAPSKPVSATLETSPDALQHLHQIAQLSPHVGPTTAEGFVQLRVTF